MTVVDPATKSAAVAAALCDLFTGITGLTEILDHEPVGQEHLPPYAYLAEWDGQGIGIDELGHELSKDDYAEVWTVRLVHTLDAPEESIPAVRSLVLQMVAACNDDATLAGSNPTGEVREAVAISWGAAPDEDDPPKRRMMRGHVEIAVLYLLPSQ
jgi:hypothetical protein